MFVPPELAEQTNLIAYPLKTLLQGVFKITLFLNSALTDIERASPTTELHRHYTTYIEFISVHGMKKGTFKSKGSLLIYLM